MAPLVKLFCIDLFQVYLMSVCFQLVFFFPCQLWWAFLMHQDFSFLSWICSQNKSGSSIILYIGCMCLRLPQVNRLVLNLQCSWEWPWARPPAASCSQSSLIGMSPHGSQGSGHPGTWRETSFSMKLKNQHCNIFIRGYFLSFLSVS